MLILCLFSLFVSARAEDVIPPVSPSESESSSSVLTSQAWEALASKDYATAKARIARCRDLYEAKAKEMQETLSVVPGPDTAREFWALNDVGTCLFILGKVAEAEGKNSEAIAAYQDVIKNFPMAQCWDKQGWFWQPAVAAKERLTALTFDSAK
ncbi:MAG: beta-glucanase precursor [Verrucomicrobia bacterium]|nr:beta-glucanase precursor [Verrucomicrobiota bacterium]NBS79454.1 beta-glucanase precursor [bacterium]NBV97055.1 beta-glucanase precursor [Verrucomicrobiota bacterium]